MVSDRALNQEGEADIDVQASDEFTHILQC